MTELFVVVVVMFGMLLAGALVQSSIVLFGLSQIITPKLFAFVPSKPAKDLKVTARFAAVD